MKLYIILFICICITAEIYGAEQSQSSSSSSASSQPPISASSIAAANASTHPLSKIFPLDLAPINELESKIVQMSPDLNYISLARLNAISPQNIHDVSKNEMIPNLGVVGAFNDNFTVLVTTEHVEDDEAERRTYHFNLYDLQEKIANVHTEPFFTIEGHTLDISPNGDYVAINRTINNNIVTSVYDIKARQHLDPQNVLFNVNSLFNINSYDGGVNFSSDSKFIAVHAPENIEIIDINSGINRPLVPSLIPVTDNLQDISLSDNFKYAILFKKLRESVLIYDLQIETTNPLSFTSVEFHMPERLTILGSDSNFLALSTGNKTDIYSLKSLRASSMPPLYTIFGSFPVLMSQDDKYIITNNRGNSINIFNTATGKLTKNVKAFSTLFSSDSKLLLASYFNQGSFDRETTVYDLESVVPLIKVRGIAAGLNSDSGVMITKDTTDEWVPKILFYDVKFLNDPAIKKILQGKLTLAQHAFIALLNKYYGSPIYLALIVEDEKMNVYADNVLRATLNSFPEIIKQAIIKTYKIRDPMITKEELEEHRAQSQSIELKFTQEREQEAGRERLINKALEGKK